MMIRKISVCTVVLILCLPLPVLHAQQAPAVEPGTRLRVTSLDWLQPEVGNYAHLTETTLQLRRGSLPIQIPVTSIGRLEMSSGTKPSFAGGAVGFVIGGLAGGAAGCHFNRDDYGIFCLGQADWKVGLGAAAGGTVSGALGALLFGRERWRPVELGQLKTR